MGPSDDLQNTRGLILFGTFDSEDQKWRFAPPDAFRIEDGLVEAIGKVVEVETPIPMTMVLSRVSRVIGRDWPQP